VVTTAADLTVTPHVNGLTITYVVDSSFQKLDFIRTGAHVSTQKVEHTHTVRELKYSDVDFCYDRGPHMDHLQLDVPLVVRNTALAYLLLNEEDKAFRVILRPTLRHNIDLYEILGTVDGEIL